MKFTWQLGEISMRLVHNDKSYGYLCLTSGYAGYAIGILTPKGWQDSHYIGTFAEAQKYLEGAVNMLYNNIDNLIPAFVEVV